MLVVDHYAIDYDWMKYFSALEVQKVVIDDLANRNHLCNILIDQNYGRSTEDYTHLVPREAMILAGSKYVFIKDDFRKKRSSALNERALRKANRINICMGESIKITQLKMFLKSFKIFIFYRIGN